MNTKKTNLASGPARRDRAQFLGVALLSSLSFTAYALPDGGQISAGTGGIATNGSAMTVTQQSQNLAINWQSFGIGASESVTFAQPNASAIALNRVLGADPSQIYGRLSANGQVWLLNPNGVLFGGGAQVNVGGLVASTLNITNADFLAGKRTFSGSGGTITNQGAISAADGGYVAMLGGKVSNEGVIQARLGTVALGAGNQVTLDFAGDKLLNLQVDQGAVNALAQNKQLIQADGGTVLLSARAADALLDTVVNNTGIIEARTIDTHNGTIKLLGGMEGGTVQVGGTVDASAPNGGDGGFIETSGAQVKVSDNAVVATSAPHGQTGKWLIDPTNFLIAPTGGDITGATLASELNGTNVTILSSSGATTGSGDIKVNDNVTWNSVNGLTLSAYHDIKVVKAITDLGTGGVTLRADNTGICVAGSRNCGTVSFTPMAHITVNGGAVNIYYNPAGSSKPADANGNGPSYTTPTDYSGHVTLNSGSTLNAWMLVNDVNQLQAMNTNLGGSYALGRNIDATATAGWNGGTGFSPVGDEGHSFSGNLEGLGHTVAGLTINCPESSYAGLIGYSSGTVRNVGLLGVSVAGRNYVGGLVGFNNHGTVSNSYSTGIVNGTTGDPTGSSEVGGLVGTNYGGIVNNSYSTSAVNGTIDVGGLVGGNSGTVNNSYSTGAINGTIAVNSSRNLGGLVGLNVGTVSNSYSTGAVYGISNIGGLVGVNEVYGTVSNSYSTGAVIGDSNVGGLVGANYEASRVSNSYSTGAVVGTIYVGGLVGYNDIPASVSNSYSTGAVSGLSFFGGLVGSNTGTVSNSYWDITTSGQSTSAGGTGLTTAQMMQQASFAGFDFTNTWWMSEGNTRPFLRMEYSTTISNAHQLQLIALNLNASYTLARDIDMSELSNPSGLWNVSTGFVPIGSGVNNRTTDTFMGTLDGSGHRVSGLTINRPSTNYIGLIGSLGTTGVVTGVGVVAANITGSSVVGGLVGYNLGGAISDSYVTGSVSGTNTNGATGGLVGINGSLYGPGTITNSYAAASVSGSGSTGGLVGSNDDGMIVDSYAMGVVHGSGYFVGGLAGHSDGVVTNSYWDIATSGQSTSAGGTGLTDAQMKQQASFVGFDFVNTWGIIEGVSYPFLLAP